MSEPVSIAKDGHVAIVTLNRPEKHNAIDLQMFAALAKAGTELGNDSSVRAVVLEGAGPSFCAGIDLSIFQQNDSSTLISKLAPGEDSPANFFQRAAFVWREVPQPVICARCMVRFSVAVCRSPWELTYDSPAQTVVCP